MIPWPSFTKAHYLLQEERLRRTLQREMPRITDELRTLLEQVHTFAPVDACLCCAHSHADVQWEASEGSSFVLNGTPLLQTLNASSIGAHMLASP